MSDATADATADDLAALQELQAADDEVRRLEHRRDGLPEQRVVEDLETRDARLVAAEDDVGARRDAALRDQRQVEGEIDALTRRRDEERARLFDGSLTQMREIQAAEAEVAATERRRSEHEDQLLEVMEAVEAAETEAAGLAADRAALAEQLTAARAARDAAAGELTDRIAAAVAARAPVLARLPEPLRARYEEAAARGQGTGVGVLRDEACTACRITFPRSDLNALLTGPPLATCPNCRRLLVIPD